MKREELRVVEDIIEGLNERRDSRWRLKKHFQLKEGGSEIMKNKENLIFLTLKIILVFFPIHFSCQK